MGFALAFGQIRLPSGQGIFDIHFIADKISSLAEMTVAFLWSVILTELKRIDDV
jgi:hypothetical protein